MNTMIAYAVDNVNGAVSSCPGPGQINNLTDLINFGTCTLMNAVIPLLVGLAIVGFVYGIIQYFLNPDNEEKRKGGKSFMLWGLITLFVMVSIWGLVGIFNSTLTPGSNPVIPSLPQSR
jgi:uncharacterized membrane-anchored protein